MLRPMDIWSAVVRLEARPDYCFRESDAPSRVRFGNENDAPYAWIVRFDASPCIREVFAKIG